MNDLVSITLLTYNHEQFINDCLESLMAQDYQNIELIILDDYSTDQTRNKIVKRLEELRKRFVRVKLLFRTHNCGNIPHNINSLINNAQGKYVKHFAGDDIMFPHCISKLVECLEKSQAPIVYSNGYIILDEFIMGNEIDTKNKLAQAVSNNITQRERFTNLMIHNYIPSPGAIFTKEIFNRYGKYDERIPIEDYEYWLRVSRTEMIYYLDEYLVLYRRSFDSLSNFQGKNGHRKFKKAFESDFITINKYMKYCDKDEEKKILKAFYKRYFDMAYYNQCLEMLIELGYRICKNEKRCDKEVINKILLMIGDKFSKGVMKYGWK